MRTAARTSATRIRMSIRRYAAPPVRLQDDAARRFKIDCARMSSEIDQQRLTILSGVVSTLLADLKAGTGDKDRRRQIEEWMRTLAEKYPEFKIEVGLRDYYLAEAERLKADFEKSS